MSENEEGHRFRERASGELALVFVVQGEGRGGMEEREGAGAARWSFAS